MHAAQEAQVQTPHPNHLPSVHTAPLATGDDGQGPTLRVPLASSGEQLPVGTAVPTLHCDPGSVC